MHRQYKDYEGYKDNERYHQRRKSNQESLNHHIHHNQSSNHNYLIDLNSPPPNYNYYVVQNPPPPPPPPPPKEKYYLPPPPPPPPPPQTQSPSKKMPGGISFISGGIQEQAKTLNLNATQTNGRTEEVERVSRMSSTKVEVYGIGAKLAMKMGWDPGKGLGKDLQGISDPIEAYKPRDRRTAGPNLASFNTTPTSSLSLDFSLNTPPSTEDRISRYPVSLEKESVKNNKRFAGHYSDYSDSSGRMSNRKSMNPLDKDRVYKIQTVIQSEQRSNGERMFSNVMSLKKKCLQPPNSDFSEDDKSGDFKIKRIPTGLGERVGNKKKTKIGKAKKEKRSKSTKDKDKEENVNETESKIRVYCHPTPSNLNNLITHMPVVLEKSYDCFLSFFEDATNFYLKTSEMIEKEKEIEEFINDFIKEKPQPLDSFKVGSLILARRPNYKFYRGEIVQNGEGTKFKVYFLDIGLIEWIESKHFRELPNDLKNFKICAVHCQLDYALANKNNVSMDILKLFYMKTQMRFTFNEEICDGQYLVSLDSLEELKYVKFKIKSDIIRACNGDKFKASRRIHLKDRDDITEEDEIASKKWKYLNEQDLYIFKIKTEILKKYYPKEFTENFNLEKEIEYAFELIHDIDDDEYSSQDSDDEDEDADIDVDESSDLEPPEKNCIPNVAPRGWKILTDEELGGHPSSIISPPFVPPEFEFEEESDSPKEDTDFESDSESEQESDSPKEDTDSESEQESIKNSVASRSWAMLPNENLNKTGAGSATNNPFTKINEFMKEQPQSSSFLKF